MKFTTTRKTVAGAAHAVSSDCSCRPSAWRLTRLRLLSQRAGRFTGSFVEILRTVIGGNGPTDTRLFILFLLAASSAAVAVVFGVAFVAILFSSTRPDVQRPLKRGKTSEAASVEADNAVQWENQSVGCGGVWERELPAALGKRQVGRGDAIVHCFNGLRDRRVRGVPVVAARCPA